MKRFLYQVTTPRSIYSIILVLLLVFFLLPPLSPTSNDTTTAASGYWTNYASSSGMTGSGTSSSPYRVYTAANLATLSGTSSNSYYYRIMNNIDMSAHYWTPPTNFTGNINGGGYTVTGIFVNGSYQSCGFIGSTSSTAGRVVLENIRLTNISVHNSYTSTSYTGLAVGKLYYASIKQVVMTGTSSQESNATNNKYTGGIVGHQAGSSSVISECYIYSTSVYTKYSKATTYTGGLVGYITSSATLRDCLAKNVHVDGDYHYGKYTSPVTYYGRIDGWHRPTWGYDSNQFQFKQTKYETYYSKAAGVAAYISGTVKNIIQENCSIYTTYSGSIYYAMETNWTGRIYNDWKCSYCGSQIGVHMKDNRWFGYYWENNDITPWYSISSSTYSHLYSYLSGQGASFVGKSFTVTSDSRTQSVSVAYQSTSYCLTSRPTSMPSGYSSSYWAVSPYIDSGKVHLKWMYWQDQA